MFMFYNYMHDFQHRELPRKHHMSCVLFRETNVFKNVKFKILASRKIIMHLKLTTLFSYVVR